MNVFGKPNEQKSSLLELCHGGKGSEEIQRIGRGKQRSGPNRSRPFSFTLACAESKKNPPPHRGQRKLGVSVGELATEEQRGAFIVH